MRTPLNRTTRRAARAFSLLELTLVLAIIGILVAMVAVNLTGSGARAKAKATTAMLNVIATAISEYHLNNNSYPATIQALVTAKYLDPTKKLKDGWDSDFVYEPRASGDKKFVLLSAGEDKTPGTEDDIDYWTMNR